MKSEEKRKTARSKKSDDSAAADNNNNDAAGWKDQNSCDSFCRGSGREGINARVGG